MHELGSHWIRELGATGLSVSAVTVGGGPLGGQPQLFGYDTPEDQAVEVVEAVLDSPIRSVDTANGYSDGASEHRIGVGLAASGGLPADFLVMTKVDARDGDYSGARVRASVAESRERLGLDTLPMVHLHDPESFDFAEMTAPGGAVDALVELREAGVIGHLGLAGGPTREMSRYLDLGVFEVLLVHNRWTLVDRSAAEILDRAAGEGLGIVNAAVYGGGILAAPRSGLTSYGYRPAPAATLSAVAAMADLCEEWDTDLATAALQFSLRDERIHSTVVGISKVGRLEKLLAAAAHPLPEEFWALIEGLCPAAEHWLENH